MMAFDQNNKRKKLADKDAGSMELGQRIFELFMSGSLDAKAALGAMKVIPMESDLGKKSLQCWKATILLESASLEQTATKSQPAQLERRKQGRRILQNMVPEHFDDSLDSNEREVVFLAMLTLGRYDMEHGSQTERARACEILARLVALTSFHGSPPLHDQATSSYNKACELLMEGYLIALTEGGSSGLTRATEHKSSKEEDAA